MLVTWARPQSLIISTTLILMGKQLLFMMYLITQLLGVHFGTGKHRADLGHDDNSRALMVNFPTPPLSSLYLTWAVVARLRAILH